MKQLLVGLFLLGSTWMWGQHSASEVLYEAKEKAQIENKNILLIYHASWCGWCKRMEENMENELVKPYFDANFVKAFMTVQEQPRNAHLETIAGAESLKQFGGERQGLPYWVILDAEGNLLADSKLNNQNLGCPATEEEVKEMLDKFSPNSPHEKPNEAAINEVFVMKKP